MNVQELAKKLQERHADCEPGDIARLCLVLLNTVENVDQLQSGDQLESACRDAVLRHQFATDQHAAMTQELEELAASDPSQFCSEQIWVLVRAIKVQSQVLQLYLGEFAIEV